MLNSTVSMLPHTNRRRARGINLVELMLALAITGMVAAGVAGMITGVSYGTTSDEAFRGGLVRQQVVTSRLDAALRSARQVLARDDHGLLLWMGDERDNGVPDLTELRLIEHEPENHQLTSYTIAFPESWSEQQTREANDSFAMDSDFQRVRERLKTHDHAVATPWSRRVRDWSITLATDQPQQATLVHYTLDLDVSRSEHSFANTVALRNR